VGQFGRRRRGTAPLRDDGRAQPAEDAATRRARARVGQLLRGKWRLDALLGIGGMACVYAATHRNGKRGAVKLLHADLCRDEEARSRFLREGYVANRVDHPGAVSVLDDDVADDGSVFLVMELLDGESVDSRADSQPGSRLGVDETLDIADRLLEVLAAAHAQGIVHRDIKPENLFLTRQGQLKVLDFGIARLREMGGGSAHATRDGSLMGTPAFMPPEQALGEWSSVDARSDLWAVGATLFCMLSGRPVHIGETVNKVLLSAMSHRAPSLATVLPQVPEAVATVIDRALMRDPDQRWPDAHAMQAALRAARAVTLRMHPPPPPQQQVQASDATLVSAVTPPPISLPVAGAAARPAANAAGEAGTMVSAVTGPITPAFHVSPSLLGTAVTASERRRSATARLVAVLGAVLTLAAVVGGVALFFRRTAETATPAGTVGETAAPAEAGFAPVSPVPSGGESAPATSALVPPGASAAASAAPSAPAPATATATATAAPSASAITAVPPRKAGARKPRRDYGF
jgi:serine/threonine-protein kinase